MTMCAHFTFKPLPGKDMVSIVELAKVAGSIWKKHGALPRLWAASSGEIGTLLFTVEFENFEAYGKCYDAMTQDPEFRQWQYDSVKQGMSEWVRANLIREILMDRAG